jgi:hypothetical protein
MTACIGASSLSASGDLAARTPDRERQLFARDRSDGAIDGQQFVWPHPTPIDIAETEVPSSLWSRERQREGIEAFARARSRDLTTPAGKA